MFDNDKYEIVFKIKQNMRELCGYGGFVSVENVKYFAINTGSGGINVYECEY